MPKMHDGTEVPYKLNEFVEETKQVDVQTPEGIKKIDVTEKVMYIDVKPKPFICAFEKHEFKTSENKRGNAECKKCGFITNLSPIHWKVVNGKAVARTDE
jgi:hypothetical protein